MTEFECPNCRQPVENYGEFCAACQKKGWGRYKNGKQVKVRK